MEEEHKTKESRDERVEKHSCQIELRRAHLKFVDYNGKQVWQFIQHPACNCSPTCEDRRRTHWHKHIYDEVIYTDIWRFRHTVLWEEIQTVHKQFRVPHGSRPHDHDRNLTLWVNVQEYWQSTPVLQLAYCPDEDLSLFGSETYSDTPIIKHQTYPNPV